MCVSCDKVLSSSETEQGSGLSVSWMFSRVYEAACLATSRVKIVSGFVFDVTCVSVLLGISVLTVVSRKPSCLGNGRKVCL